MFFVAFERAMLQHMEEVKQQLTELRTSQTLLTAKVDHLLRHSGATHQQGDPLPEDVVFPLSSLEALDALEEVLKDNQQKQLVVCTMILTL